MFIDWLTQRNETVSDSEVLPNILESEQPQETLDLVLATFLLESRRKDGNCYPANTLRNILGSLYRVMKDKYGAKSIISFMEKDSRERFYPKLYNAMDRQFRLLRASGVGVSRQLLLVMKTRSNCGKRKC